MWSATRLSAELSLLTKKMNNTMKEFRRPRRLQGGVFLPLFVLSPFMCLVSKVKVAVKTDMM